MMPQIELTDGTCSKWPKKTAEMIEIRLDESPHAKAKQLLDVLANDPNYDHTVAQFRFLQDYTMRHRFEIASVLEQSIVHTARFQTRWT